MYNTAYRIVQQTTEAEDVMQEGFIIAFTKLSTLKDKKMFGSWLKRIIVNASIAKFHENKKTISIEANQIAIPEVKEEEESIPYFSKLKAKEVLQALETLKPSYRTILTLHYIEGYDYQELEILLNRSYGNCRTLLSRAKESLRKKLTNE